MARSGAPRARVACTERTRGPSKRMPGRRKREQPTNPRASLCKPTRAAWCRSSGLGSCSGSRSKWTAARVHPRKRLHAGGRLGRCRHGPRQPQRASSGAATPARLRVEAPLPAPRAAEAPPARRAARLQPPRRRPHVRPPPPAPPLRRRFSAAAPTPGLTARRRGLCAPARREARGWGPRTLSGKDRPTSVLDAGCAVLSFLPLASDRAAAAAGVAVALPLLAMASPRGAVGFVRQVRATPPSRRRDAACPISTG
jgi:hypothetical protein